MGLFWALSYDAVHWTRPVKLLEPASRFRQARDLPVGVRFDGDRLILHVEYEDAISKGKAKGSGNHCEYEFQRAALSESILAHGPRPRQVIKSIYEGVGGSAVGRAARERTVELEPHLFVLSAHVSERFVAHSLMITLYSVHRFHPNSKVIVVCKGTR